MTAWDPVITDPVLVRRAEQIIARTADFFSARLSRRTGEANPRLDHFLDALSGVDGVSAVALLFAYLHLELGEPGTIEATSAWLDRAIDVTVRLEQPKPWLYSGVAGCAWAIEHILPRVGDPTDQADPNEDVDAVLAEFLTEHRGSIDPELVMGLAGIGTYFLERLPRPSAFAGLELVLAQLAQQAEYLDIGITWRKGLAALSREHRTEYPAGLYNLGIPHGVPGIVAFLARLCSTPRTKARVSCSRAR